LEKKQNYEKKIQSRPELWEKRKRKTLKENKMKGPKKK
jgi:hypothetical protein